MVVECSLEVKAVSDEIELGDTVKDIYSGFRGVATVKSEFINGCIQYAVLHEWDKKDKGVPEELGIDSQSLVVLKRGKRYKEKKKKERLERLDKDDDEDYSGGPMRKAPKMRGF
jgi:hypothetical protein